MSKNRVLITQESSRVLRAVVARGALLRDAAIIPGTDDATNRRKRGDGGQN